ncbi:hypothetical protein NC651_037520 [Populus alba x Populus x berolinensis]|nr:hypothetical protein NC651_037520 [Populus alba x Populus x berolinensis]
MSTTAADAKAEHFELNNGTIRVTVTNYGAIITSLYVPDKHGKVADVVLGFDSIEAYVVSFSDPFCFSVRLSFLVASAAKSCGFDTVFMESFVWLLGKYRTLVNLRTDFDFPSFSFFFWWGLLDLDSSTRITF